MLAAAVRSAVLCSSAGGLLPFMILQKTLSDTDGFRGNFHQLVVSDELDGRFQGKLNWGRQGNGLVGSGCAYIRQLFPFYGIDHQIVVPAVNADYHSLVQAVPGLTNMRPRSCNFQSA